MKRWVIFLFSLSTSLYAIDPYQDLFSFLDQLQGDISSNAYTYQAYVHAGEELEQTCAKTPRPQFPGVWDKQQAMLAMAASVQSIGIHQVAKKLGQLANDLSIEHASFSVFSDGLIDNYCSQNFTLSSKKQLKQSLIQYYELAQTSVGVSSETDKIYDQQALERVFYWSTQLFKGLCAWGNDPYDYQALTPLLNDPFIMSEVFRQLQAQRMIWNESEKKMGMVADPQYGRRALCHHRICREVSAKAFHQYFPRGVGHKDLTMVLEGIYCHEFRNLKFIKASSANLKQLYTELFLDADRPHPAQVQHYRAFFSSLLANIPYYTFNISDHSILGVIQQAYTQVWNTWSIESLKQLKDRFFHEDALTIEVVERDLYFRPKQQNFNLVLDVNLGELDRSHQILGKLTSVVHIPLSHSLLAWAKRNVRQSGKTLELIKRLGQPIKLKLQSPLTNLPFARYPTGLEDLLANELLDQLALIEGDLRIPAHEQYQLPVQFNFAPYALRYLHHQGQSKP